MQTALDEMIQHWVLWVQDPCAPNSFGYMVQADWLNQWFTSQLNEMLPCKASQASTQGPVLNGFISEV